MTAMVSSTQLPCAAAAEGLGDQRAGDHRRGQPHGVAQHRRARPKMLGELARIVVAARREGGKVDFADRRRRRRIVGDRAFEPLDMAARVEQARDRRLGRRAPFRIEFVAGGEPRRLAPHRVGRQRVAGRQPRLGAGQQFEAQVLQVERGGAQRDADARRQRPRRRPVAQGGQIALRRHHRVEESSSTPIVAASRTRSGVARARSSSSARAACSWSASAACWRIAAP